MGWKTLFIGFVCGMSVVSLTGAELGPADPDGTTPLHWAVRHDDLKTAEALIKAGADVNAVDTRGDTALHGAAGKGYDEVVKFLAEHGANLNLKDKQGKTALDAAIGNAGGGGGFDGSRKDVHESTAKLLRQLMAADAAKASAQ